MPRALPSHTTLAAAGLAALLLVAGCGDDGSDASDRARGGATTTEATGGRSTFCDGIVGFDAVPTPGGPSDPTADDMRAYAAQALVHVDDIVAGAPSDLHDAVATLQAAIGDAGGGSTKMLSDPGVRAAAQTLEQAARDHCDVTKVDLTATEFRFDGVPESIPAGRPISFRMTDRGSAPHLMLLAKAPADGTDDQAFLGDFLTAANGGPEAFAPFERYDVVGAFPFADPGTTDTALKQLEPGAYVYFCPLPVGDDPTGPSHFEQGMHGRFTVEAR